LKDSSRGFTNQQALLVLLICFPIGLIALGIIVILIQRPAPRIIQPQQTPSLEQPSDRSTTIQPLPSSPQPAPQQSGLSELEARAIVEQWLTVKSQIFAPPFDTDLANEIVASGPLWADITKTGGSIDWLRNNDSYYTYSKIKVNQVVRFLPSTSMPSIVVSVTEDSTLHSPKGNKATSSNSNWIYTIKEEGGAWKIWDYRKQ
jgi:hypothetical protein